MGLNKFVSLFADAVLSPDCNHPDRHAHADDDAQSQNQQHNVARAATIVVRPDGRIVAASAMYNSELDIYGTAARFKKSLLWGSLRKPRKSKDHNRLVSAPTASAPSKVSNTTHHHLAAATTTKPAAQHQRTTAHQNASAHVKSTTSGHLSSATLKTSPLANGLQRTQSACPVTSTQLEPTTTAEADSPQIGDGEGIVAAAAPVARVSVAVDCTVETVSKAIGAHLGCGGGDQCDNSKGVEALGVLLQYLVFHMDAFGNAHWQKSCQTSNRALDHTTGELITERSLRADIEQQLAHNARCHDAELHKANAIELELRERIGALTATENELREKVHASDAEFGERLSAAAQRERDLNDRLLAVQRQLATAGKEAELQERQWQEKWTLCQDELAVMRARSAAEAMQQQQQQSSPQSNGSAKPQRMMLQDEVESLRCVLDLKQTEISELRKQNHELIADAEAMPALKLRVHTLESRLEDVQQQLQMKCAEEKDLRSKMKHMEQCYAHETNKSKSVTLHNEQLQFKLMQNSEKFSNTLTELSKHYHGRHADYLNAAKASLYGQENSSASDISSTSNTSLLSNKSFGHNATTSSALGETDAIDAAITSSPPSTPVVKGVVEKSESVSWVLEINDDESAEALASRIVRRAGSFRSNLSDKWSAPQLSTPASMKKRSSLGGNGEANPLSQSASATSILRQCAEGSSPVFTRHKAAMRTVNTTPPPTLNATALGAGRRRSKSVSTASSSSSSASSTSSSSGSGSSGSTIKPLEHWAEKPIRASSPDPQRQRSAIANAVDFEDVVVIAPAATKQELESPKIVAPRRNNATSNASSRRGASTVAVAAVSIQDSPKFQQIKESAGEAMVSGTNSEDDDDDDDEVDDEAEEDIDEYPLLIDLTNSSSDESSMSVSSDGHGNHHHHHHDADVIMQDTNRSQDDAF